MSNYQLAKRSETDIYLELKTKYPNKPDWLFNEHARLYGMKSELTNIIANDIIDPKTRRSAYMFAKKRSYEPVEADGATTQIVFTLREAMNKTLPVGYRVGGQSSVSSQFVKYELTSAASSGGTNTITATGKQKETFTEVSIGMVESTADFYEHPIDGYKGIIKTSIRIWIDDIEWFRRDYLYEADSDDRVFAVSYDDYGIMWLIFGDNKTGSKPLSKSEIRASFECTNGLAGRVEAGDIRNNLGNDSDIISVTCEASSGGNDAEAVASIKRNAVKTYRLRDAVFTLEDCEIAALKASSNVVKAKAIRGDQTLAIHVIGAGGGTISPDELTYVSEYVQALTAFGDEIVHVFNAQKQTENIVASISARAGYNKTLVANLCQFALYLVSSSWDVQILDLYDDRGISATRELLINPIGYSFSRSDEGALDYILKMWRKLLGDREFRGWGQKLSEADLLAMAKGLVDFGLQSISMTNPTNDIECISDMYIIDGNVTVSS